MSIPPRLADKFHEVIGAAATEDLVTWMDTTRAQHAELRADIAELRQELRVAVAGLSGQLAAQSERFSGQLAAQSAQLSERFSGQLAAQSAQLSEQMSRLATELRGEVHAVDNKIERRFSDLLLWSFVFWVGAVGAVALLAGVLKG